MMTMAGAPGPSQTTVQQQQRHTKPEDAALHITVSDPVQQSEGLNKYTSYRVDVRPPATVPSNETNQDILLQNTTYSAVLRRYSDFLWLYEKLHQERAGAIIPPLPEKQPVGRFSAAFVEDRRVNLERFLRRVAIHPELSDAKCLDTFLRADDMTFQAAKHSKVDLSMSSTMQPTGDPSAPYQNRLTPQKKDGFSRWFAESKTSISGNLVKSPDDDIFDEINRYIHGLDNQMRNVSYQATGLVRKGKEIANGLFEFGLAFNLLGQSEADILGDALGKMGETADRLSVLSAEHAEREMAQFEEPLQDYIKTIHSVKLALQRRHEKRLTYSTCLAEVESKQVSLSKLRMSPGMDAKAYTTEMALNRAQEAAEIAKDDFATVSQRVLREVDRFRREKAEDMRRTVLNYINLQVEYNKRMEEVWSVLIPQLESVQLSSGDNNKNNNNVSQSIAPASGTTVAADSSASGASSDVAAATTPALASPPSPAVVLSQQPQQQQQQQQQPPPQNPYYTGTAASASQQPPVPQAPNQITDPMINLQYRE